MGRVIAVANQKGGVGKSTTAINLSACLAEKGKKVLAIDIDPQGNTTSGLGVDKNNVENTLYELLLGEAEAKDTIVKDVVENVDLIPSNVNLSGAEIELIGVDEKEYIMKKIIDKVRRKYDYIIMDCPPSLNMLTINALTAANSVLVPIQCEYYALEGLSQLIHTIELVMKFNTVSFWQIPDTSFISCSIRRTVISKFLHTNWMVSISSPVSFGFMPAAGSSRSRSFGSVARARAISSLRCLPYGRLDAL